MSRLIIDVSTDSDWIGIIIDIRPDSDWIGINYRCKHW